MRSDFSLKRSTRYDLPTREYIPMTDFVQETPLNNKEGRKNINELQQLSMKRCSYEARSTVLYVFKIIYLKYQRYLS